MMYGVLHQQSVFGVGVQEYSGDGFGDGLWGRRWYGMMYGVLHRWSVLGVGAWEYSGDGGRKLCPLTDTIIVTKQEGQTEWQ